MFQISLIFWLLITITLLYLIYKPFLDQFPDSAIYNQFYGGMNVNANEEEQLKVAEEIW